jgi:signal transduction histidine kinase/CheY-like chemotaxis protein
MGKADAFARLSRAVQIISLSVSILAGIAVPMMFGIMAYRKQIEHLSFRADLAAKRVAEYAYVHGATWRFSDHRIADLISFTHSADYQVVWSGQDDIVATAGEPISGPTLRVLSPIVVRGASIGRVELQVSLVPLLWTFGIVGLIGLVLGAIGYLCLRFMPLRALETVVREYEAMQVRLRQQVDQTQSALESARAAMRAKSEFLATMSHEIRTPMNAVIGLSSSLLEAGLDAEKQSLVETIHNSSCGLLRLLNDALDFSKLDAQKVELENIGFSPATIVADVVRILGPKVEEKGLKLDVHVDPELPACVTGDPVRLRQVLMNLVSNATKFTERGGIEIAMRNVSREAGRATIELKVRDTGIGMSCEQMSGLFQPFAQADSTINRRFGGTGLGLTISKRLVELMGADISVTSTLGAGATFTVRLSLPIVEASEHLPPNDAAKRGAHQQILMNLAEPLRILLAEDSGSNQLVFRQMLKKLIVTITIAKNGVEAVKQASEAPFDVIFMDVQMPEMDGITATRKIRERQIARAQVPIVALTANAFSEDVRSCYEAGMTDFVAKPISKDILIEKLAMIAAGLSPENGRSAVEHVVTTNGKAAA